ncbi:MAG: hypothetical protein M1570_07530 [Chloroflexi bacterium]|nr:hypothetical protein [Chloroflexota bacterium]
MEAMGGRTVTHFPTTASLVELDVLGNGKPVTLEGLAEIFEEMFKLGWMPNAACEYELLRRVRARNHVPASFERAYATALGREYDKFHARKKPHVSG